MSRILPILVLLSLLVLSGATPEQKANSNKEINLQWGVKIPLRDGVKLNATVYQPKGADKLPAVFTLTPYIADNYHDRALYFARNGYVFVLVDARGRGSSEGDFEPFVNEGRDGHDVVLWLAKQPWCNGKVAMWGGSYAGFNQWSTLKEFPAPLATIVPAASAHFGVDFPAPANIFPAYIIRWLTLTSGKTPNQKLFQETAFWNQKYTELYRQHLPFSRLDEVVGNTSTHFQTWIKHRLPGPYWDDTAPTAKHYERMNLPILTITGHYDDDQPGAMAYYRRHMRYGSAEGKAKHYLIMGPWDHAGTRTPTDEVGGVHFDKACLLDLNQLHKEWYDWTMKEGKKPAFLKDRVAYYVAGAEQWKYAASLEAIPTRPRTFYLHSTGGQANDVFRSGTLSRDKPGQQPPDKYVYDPLDLRPGEREREDDKFSLTDQREVLNLFSNGLVYHSEPFDRPTEVSGYLKFVAWIALDVPDTDFQVAVYEIKPDGSSIALTEDRMRARYREGLGKEVLARPGEINRHEFNSFTWFSRQLAQGSRLRLVLRSPNSIHWEKNYNSGGAVEKETKKDARTAHVSVFHDREHPSFLEVPVAEAPAQP